jgi:tRNA(fMet)-specific endonuclease VapC
MIFVDTDVLVAHQRGDASATAALHALQARGETLATTSINVAELFHGAERSREREAAIGNILLMLDGLIQVPFGPVSARRFGAIMAALHKAGSPVPPVDGLIAAVVLENGGRLVTRNARHFARIHGLDLVRVP